MGAPIEELRIQVWEFFAALKDERLSLTNPVWDLMRSDKPKHKENLSSLNDQRVNSRDSRSGVGNTPQTKVCHLHPAAVEHWTSRCPLIVTRKNGGSKPITDILDLLKTAGLCKKCLNKTPDLDQHRTYCKAAFKKRNGTIGSLLCSSCPPSSALYYALCEKHFVPKRPCLLYTSPSPRDS